MIFMLILFVVTTLFVFVGYKKSLIIIHVINIKINNIKAKRKKTVEI